MKRRNKGISLISLIITIIVIIILSAIVIFTGLGTPNSANFAKFASEFSDFEMAITNDYMNRKTEYAVNGQTRSENQIYYMIASGTEIDMNDEPIAVGVLEELGLNIMPEELHGVEYYEITSDKNVENWQKQNYYYAKDEKHYVTDKGETFMLPGYLQEDNGTKKWWVNENKYYVSDKPIKGADSINLSNIKITMDVVGTTVAGTNIEEGTTLYINFDTSRWGTGVTVSPSLPYAVTENGEYEFILTRANGSNETYKVTVSNYKVPIVANIVEVGDYIEYMPDSSTYKTNKNNTGYTSSQTLATEAADWRVLYVNENTGEVLITPNGVVNSGTFLSGTKGYFRGPIELNNICAALYSNNSLGITARSMTIEDLNNACNYTPSLTGCAAYYKNGTTFPEGDTTIKYNGKTYTKRVQYSSTAKFYTSDGGGVEKTDSDGFTYREPDEDNPVYVTSTFYPYQLNTYNSKVSSIIGNSKAWLASSCVSLATNYVSLGVCITNNGGAGFFEYMCYSDGSVFGGKSCGVHPIVSLNSMFQIDKSDLSMDGSTAAKAWKIIKK